MSQNLHLLRQNYCRPVTFTGKRSRDLFRLEKECEEGKALLAKTPNTLLHLLVKQVFPKLKQRHV